MTETIGFNFDRGSTSVGIFPISNPELSRYNDPIAFIDGDCRVTS
jgi:hypothetical protein